MFLNILNNVDEFVQTVLSLEKEKHTHTKRFVLLDKNSISYLDEKKKVVNLDLNSSHIHFSYQTAKEKVTTCSSIWFEKFKNTYPALNPDLTDPKIMVEYSFNPGYKTKNIDIMLNERKISWNAHYHFQMKNKPKMVTKENFEEILTSYLTCISDLPKADKLWKFTAKTCDNNQENVIFPGQTAAMAAIALKHMTIAPKTRQDAVKSAKNLILNSVVTQYVDTQNILDELDTYSLF
jgi:hypothetical protein